MNPTGPWWGGAALAFGGVLLTLSATLWIDYRKGRRETAFRWTERKMALYTGYLKLCKDLRDLPVWPDLGAEKPLLEQLRTATNEIEFIAPAAVTTKADAAAAALEKLVGLARKIRDESKPAHQNAVASSFREEYSRAVTEVSAAIGEFTERARTDADIRSRFAALPRRGPAPPTDPPPR